MWNGDPNAQSQAIKVLDATTGSINPWKIDANGNAQTKNGPLTASAGTNSIVTTGQTAVVAVTGPCTSGFILNPYNAAAQGIAVAETLYVDPVASPGYTDASANGTCSPLVAGQAYSFGPMAAGQEIRVNAATSGHKFTVVVYA
jgi:hypothetical protein